jgi:hypothetical protein
MIWKIELIALAICLASCARDDLFSGIEKGDTVTISLKSGRVLGNVILEDISRKSIKAKKEVIARDSIESVRVVRTKKDSDKEFKEKWSLYLYKQEQRRILTPKKEELQKRILVLEDKHLKRKERSKAKASTGISTSYESISEVDEDLELKDLQDKMNIIEGNFDMPARTE